MVFDALVFTIWQALLSAGLSAVVGIALGWAILRINLRGRGVIEAALLLPFFLPPLLLIIAVLRLFGRGGLDWPVFGVWGIVLCHVLLNAPLVFHLYLQEWRRVPEAQFKVALGAGALWPLVERPLLRRLLPSAFGLALLYSALSFTIVIVLGGANGATTLELAIYQAVKFDFDLVLASQLAMVQAALGLAIYLFLRRARIEADFAALGTGFNLHPVIAKRRTRFAWLMFLILSMALFAPLAALLIEAPENIRRIVALWHGSALAGAFFQSLQMAFLASLLALVFGFVVLKLKIEGFLWLLAAISPLVLSLGFIVLIRGFANPFEYGLPFVIFLQVLALSPIIARNLSLRQQQIAPELQKLAQLTFSNPWARFRHFHWPIWRETSLRVFLIAFALVIGDLSVLPLLAPPGFQNLPMMIYQLMAAYRFDDAKALGFLLLLLAAGALALSALLMRREKQIA